MASVARNWRPALAVAAVVVIAVGVAGAVDPQSAGAIDLNPIHAVKNVAGTVASAPSKLGAKALQEGLEWLLGGIKAVITLALVKFIVTVQLPVGGSLNDATGPILVIGGFFLIVGLITSIADGYREVIASADTTANVIGSAVFRVIGLALLLGSWFWLVRLAVDMANGMTHYVLSDQAVGAALRRSFAGQSLTDGVFPLLALITDLGLAIALLILLVMKFILAIGLACLYVGGPALIGFSALPRVGRLPLSLLTRGLAVMTLIPLAWTIVFVAWAGVSAGMVDALEGRGSGLVNAVLSPALFLAGIVVMLGATKKLLAMASFGLPLAIPGSGIAKIVGRTALTLGAGAAIGKVGEAVAGAAASKAGGGPQPEPRPHDSAHQAATSAAQGQGRGQESGGQRQGEHFQRRRPLSPDAVRADRRTAREARAANGGIGVFGWSGEGSVSRPANGPTSEQGETARARLGQLEQGQDEDGAGDARRVMQQTVASDRAALAKWAAEANQEAAGDKRRAKAILRDTYIRHAEPIDMDRGTRAAMDTAVARGPDWISETFGGDLRAMSGTKTDGNYGYDVITPDDYNRQRRTTRYDAGQDDGSVLPF